MRTVYLVGPLNTDSPTQYEELRKAASVLGGAYCPRTSHKNKTLTAPSFLFLNPESAKEFEIILEKAGALK